MKGMKVGEMVKQALVDNLQVRLEVPICPKCAGPIRVDSYVLLRPEAGKCADCGLSWSRPLDGPLCPDCGYSSDHREGFGCTPDA